MIGVLCGIVYLIECYCMSEPYQYCLNMCSCGNIYDLVRNKVQTNSIFNVLPIYLWFTEDSIFGDSCDQLQNLTSKCLKSNSEATSSNRLH